MSRRKNVIAACIVFLLAAVAWLYWFVTAHGFSAREKPWAVEAFIARHLRRLATAPAVKKLPNPVSPTPLNIAEARDHFADHCAICHANDGSGRTQINAGLYPPAPDMREEDTQSLTDGELLYIIKNGIRFTGMPGWGGEDEENWKLVLFIRHLPDLAPSEIELMKEINGLETEQESGQPSTAPHEDSHGPDH